MPRRKRFLVDMAERVAATFAQGFLAAWLVLGDTQADQLLTERNLKIGLVAGIIAVAKAFLAKLRGRNDSASLAASV